MQNLLRAAIAMIAAVIVVAQSASAGDSVEPYVRPKQMVDVGNGRHLNLYCSGSGAATIVLDLGFGVSAYNWHTVFPQLAAHTRTCFYERAGYGFSDPGVRPQDTNAIVEDLHAMLHNGHVPGPYVFVAHSMAGEDAMLYADRYRPEVAGMVVITPSEPGDDQFDAIFGKAKDDAERAATLKLLQGCANQAHHHQLKVGGCVRPDPSLPAPIHRGRYKLAFEPGIWDAYVSEWSNFKNDDREVRAEQRVYGRLPLIVLTAAGEEDDAKGDGATDAQIAQANVLLRRLRAADASYSQIGMSCVVQKVTGEFIQTQRPQAVIDATLDVLREAQAGARAKAIPCHY